jgi:uncharacterized membrane protein YraQ (UPF0718 family)
MIVGSKQRVPIAVGLLFLIVLALAIKMLSPAALRDVTGGYHTFVTVFLGIFIEALPFLLLGTLASGLVEVFISREALGRMVPRNRVGAALTGALMGLAFPVCECGVVPLTRRFFRKGVPLSVGVAFLLAAPVINPVVIASTYAAFGWGSVLLGRIVFALLIAVAVGLIFSLADQPLYLLRFSAWPVVLGGSDSPERSTARLSSPRQPGKLDDTGAIIEGNPVLSPGVTARPDLSDRLTRVLSVAGDEFFEMGRYLVIGCLLAAGMQTFVPQSALLSIGGGALSSVVAMLALAFVLSICSTVDAFLALALVNTFTTGSILTFLVFGPMVDIKSVVMFSTVFRRRSVVYLVLLPLMMTLFMGVYLNLNVAW